MRTKQKLLAGLAVLAASVAAISVAAASTTTINPAGDSLLATSANATFGIGTGTITCPLSQAYGTSASPAAESMHFHGPGFGNLESKRECSSTGLGGLTFNFSTESGTELIANSPSSASLKFANEFNLFVNSKLKGETVACSFHVVSGSSITGSWAAHEKSGLWYEGLAAPSNLTFSNASIPIGLWTTTGCPAAIKEAKSMSFSASYVLNDVSALSSIVSLK